MAMASNAVAQQQAVALVTQVPAATRAAAMGNAYALGLPDADALFYHPGLLDAARGIGASFARWGSGATLVSAAAAAEWWRGGVGIGVQALSWGAPSLAAGAFARGEAGLGETGNVAGSEQTITAAYARTLFGFRVGIAGRLIDARQATERDLTAAADIGLARSVGPVVVGLTARNIGRDPAYDAFDAELPTSITLGGGSRSTQLGPLDLNAAAYTSWTRGDRWAAGGGLEVSYWPVSGRTFIARAGYRWVDDVDLRPLTIGAGFSGDRIAIDWAYQDVEDGDGFHRVSLRFR
jgi:hypothetical protein